MNTYGHKINKELWNPNVMNTYGHKINKDLWNPNSTIVKSQ